MLLRNYIKRCVFGFLFLWVFSAFIPALFVVILDTDTTPINFIAESLEKEPKEEMKTADKKEWIALKNTLGLGVKTHNKKALLLPCVLAYSTPLQEVVVPPPEA